LGISADKYPLVAGPDKMQLMAACQVYTLKDRYIYGLV
jgi:hypothetical protein